MPSTERTNTVDVPDEWIVSPMTSTQSTTDLTQLSAQSPPPYTPTATDATSLSWQPFDDKCAPGSEQALINEIMQSQNNQLAVPSGTSFRGSASRGSSISRKSKEDDLPEVVPCSFPEVASSSLPECAASTLPQAVQVASSSAPEIVPGSVLEPAGLEVGARHSDLEVSSVATYAVPTVTPLHLLGDQPDQIDCPFCFQQTMTRVKKKPSNATQYVVPVTLPVTKLTLCSIQAVLLLLTTVCGAAAPYIGSWSFDIEHYCTGCQNRVAYRAKGKEIYVCKQPESVRQASKYAAPSDVSSFGK